MFGCHGVRHSMGIVYTNQGDESYDFYLPSYLLSSKKHDATAYTTNEERNDRYNLLLPIATLKHLRVFVEEVE